MNLNRKNPGFWYGVMAGLFLTIPLIALFYLTNRLVGTPYVPFDFFEWLARNLPGQLVASGISLLVQVLTFFNLSVREASKPAEILAALGQFTVLGMVIGGVVYTFLNRFKQLRKNYASGTMVGAILGVIFILISFNIGKYSAVPVLSAFWVFLLFLLWGTSMQWIYHTQTTKPMSVHPIVKDTPGNARMVQVDRRKFVITMGGISAAITVIGAGLGSLLEMDQRQPVAVTGEGEITLIEPTPERILLPQRPNAVMPVPGTRPEYTPLKDHYRIDINLDPPRINGDTWRLPITGLVNNPHTLNLNDFYEERFGRPMHLFITLACISNEVAGDLVSTTRWTGISLQRILDEVDLQVAARYLWIDSRDGFYETVPVDLIRSDERIMLTYLWDGRPLLSEHGYPLRIYIPDRYGMKQPKWITSIEAKAEDRDGYWVERGWDKIAQMKATSVIDVVGVNEVIERDGETYIPIGGIARAGARGISRVEVKVDEGEWQEAQLRTPLSDLTWVLWRFEWPFQAGEHTFTVRCYDGDEERQIAEPSPPAPDGATGLNEITRDI